MTCNECSGSGWLNGGVCKCKLIQSAKFTVLQQVPKAKRLERGLLVDKEPYQGSALIRASWQVMQNHLAGWLFPFALRGRPVRYALRSTAKLRSDYVSNTLPELSAHDLVIVQVLGTNNPILKSVLLETVSVAKNIWLVSPL